MRLYVLLNVGSISCSYKKSWLKELSSTFSIYSCILCLSIYGYGSLKFCLSLISRRLIGRGNRGSGSNRGIYLLTGLFSYNSSRTSPISLIDCIILSKVLYLLCSYYLCLVSYKPGKAMIILWSPSSWITMATGLGELWNLLPILLYSNPTTCRRNSRLGCSVLWVSSSKSFWGC